MARTLDVNTVIEFFVLGRIDLQGIDAAAAAELLGQPRPTALLAYMAIRPSDFQRRDRLATLFWAESDQAHARANLRKLFSMIRKLLGEEIFESRGDEEIRLLANAVYCDAAEFEQCVRVGRTARALEIYQGPLMPSFSVGGAPGFEDWLDRTRRQLARLAVETALKVADQYMENAERTQASDLAHFIGQREPDLEDEHQLRKLLKLLDRIGDRVGALTMYEDFKDRLWRDYKAQPSPETRQLIDRIRNT